MSDENTEQQLLIRINDRRREVELFLTRARPRSERLSQVSVISSGLAAALTAGPALGGQGFTATVAGGLELADQSIVWRVLCLLAMAISVTAAVSANLGKSRNSESRIISAETASSELEGLHTLLEFKQIALVDAIKLYSQYTAKVPFVTSTDATVRR